MSYTQPNIMYQTFETWQANSLTGNTPTAIKSSVPMETHSFPVSTHLSSIKMLVILSLKR